ncbi:MAG: 2,3-bisphosphoglycerate-independent phosphoglycerate mutase [Dehalococcoidia bacterium]
MDSLELIRGLARPSPSKIVMLVIDGLGGLPHLKTGKTELETARTPNLDKLAAEGVCGLIDTVGPGITPGSTPGHLALFGYDPLKYDVGRGVVEAAGIDFDLRPGDMAARGNFCTVDDKGLITDRRAGRISTEQCAQLCKLLDGMTVEEIKLSVLPVREHRFIVVFKGEELRTEISESDPQQTGVLPLEVKAESDVARRTAHIVNGFIAQAKAILSGHHPANMLLLRGFSQRPELPSMPNVYRLKPAAIAAYPMYRGLAKFVGMTLLETGAGAAEEMEVLKKNYNDYDFFFVHIKKTDSAGEDGDFERKVAIIEEVDKALPVMTGLKPDVIVVSGDHSTPARLKGHSWHPLPALIHSEWCRPDPIKEFAESSCIAGGLGHFHATRLMPLAMAHALKLNKFGA